ncbi:MAG: hypothetical protein R6U21_05285 [Thermoplasmatota archaeon]
MPSKVFAKPDHQGTNGEVSILQPNTTALMHSIQYPENNSGNPFQYELGWMIDTSGEKPFEGHTGVFLEVNQSWSINQAKKQESFSFLINEKPYGSAHTL